MEKLIEEIAYLLSCHRFTSNDIGIVQADRDYAREAITRIGKAYADGMPLPGEVGRIPADMLGGGKGEVVHVREGDTIIILRQGGTGKEEEE